MNRSAQTTPSVGKNRRSPSSRSGFTIIELTAASALVVVMLGATYSLVVRSQLFFEDQGQRYQVESTGQRVLAYLGEELRVASRATVLPVVMDDSPSIQFQRVIGVDGAGDPTLGPLNTLAFQLAAGETEDALDENGDGRADEGSLMHDVDGEDSRIIAENILGIRFDRTSRGVSISVDVGLLDRNGLLIQQTFTEQIRFRHP